MDDTASLRLPVNDIHTGIQLLGRHAGTPVTFITLQGCDVRCPWCNVPETWQLHTEPNPEWKRPLRRWLMLTVNEVVTACKQFKQKRVVITGGEPLMHELAGLIHGLSCSGYQVQVETSGTKDTTSMNDLVWLTVSPKVLDSVLPKALVRADEIVFPIVNQQSIRELQQQIVNKIKPTVPVYLHVIGSQRLISQASQAAFTYNYLMSPDFSDKRLAAGSTCS